MIGGGEATAHIDARQTSDGIALNARVQFTGVDGAALHYRQLDDARGPRLDADDAGEPRPQHVGADRGVVRKRRRDAGIRCASPGSIRARSRSRSAPAMPGRRPTTPGCGRSSNRCCRPARCRSRRRKFRSLSGTAGFASAPPRSMPKAPAPSCPAATIFPPTRPTFAPRSLRPAAERRRAARKFSCSRRARPTRSIEPSTLRRCRHGWR